MDEIFELITDIEGELDNLSIIVYLSIIQTQIHEVLLMVPLCSVYVLKEKLEQISHKVLEYDLDNE